ncbi:MAG: glycosyl hydrolase family 28 protein [Planctomycetaceae bacterium]|nr:glycosyl hydrolase family 28 protein [Planctomycetaceae bacterium]
MQKIAISFLSIPFLFSAALFATETPIDHVFHVRDFGAVGDGQTKDTAAIQKAVDAATQSGGGQVLLTPGTYLSGTIHLKNNVDFHLMAGAVLYGSPDKEDYNAPDFCPQNRVFPGDFMSGAHLIVAVEQSNVTISGRGRIDGNGKAFLKDPESDRFLPKNKITWRPAQMLFFCESTNITIRDVELFNSPYWTCFLHGCEDILMNGVRINNRLDTANGDGIDMDCCQRGTISNCLIESGDDCITLRANEEPLKKKRPCELIAITNCVLKTPCQAVRVGVGNGKIRHCTFSNLVIHDTSVGLNFYSSYSPNSPGTTIENIRFDNIVMSARVPFIMTLGYAVDSTKIRNIYFRGISGVCRATSPIGGKPDNALLNISFEDIDLAVPQGSQPFTAMQLSHIDGLRLKNVRIFEWDKSNEPSPFAIRLNTIEHGVYDHCWPIPEETPPIE